MVSANRTTDMTLLTECEAFCASAVYKHGPPPGVSTDFIAKLNHYRPPEKRQIS